MNYQKMYTLLFNAITDALKQMESQNFGTAKKPSSLPSKKQKNSICQQNPNRGSEFFLLTKKQDTQIGCPVYYGAGDEARSRHCRAATRTAGDKRPTGAFSRFARALFDPLPAGTKK